MSESDSLVVLKKCFSKVIPDKEDGRTNISLLQFIVNLVFCYFGDSRIFSLESIRKKIKGNLMKSYSRSAFWERLSGKRLKYLLRKVVAELMVNLNLSNRVNKDILHLLGVKAIKAVDSSSITLKDVAKRAFPGTFTDASIKWHVCFDILSGMMGWFQLTSGKVHDSKCFPDINSLRGELIIFDLGYYNFSLLYALENSGCFFLSRLKSGAVIHISEVICGLSRDVIGTILPLNLTDNKGDIIEILTEKTHNKQPFVFRVIGFWNPTEECYHWYISNLKAAASLIYPLYRLRWQIELIFKACKSSLNANEIPSGNTNIIESLLLASIAGCLSSHVLLNVGTEQLNEEERLASSFQRAAKTSVELAKDFVMFILDSSQAYLDILISKIKLFAPELFDPNYRKRETSLMRVHRLLLSPSRP